MISDDEFKKRLLAPLNERTYSGVEGIHPVVHHDTGIKQNSGIITESIASYIANPTGKGSAYLAKRATIKQGLNLTFIKLLQKYRRHFYATPYIYSSGDILFWVKVPSEDYEHNKIAYDVMFFIKYNKNVKLVNRDIEVYSNCPSFVFTYCYVYNQRGLFLSKLRDKMPSEVLTRAPEIRNPIQSLGYEKSTYIAARYLVDGHCLADDYIARFGKKIDQYIESNIFREVADPETIIAVYQHARYKFAKSHRKKLTKNEIRRRDKMSSKYVTQQKKIEPKGGFIFHKAPRAKITARKAKRNLLN